METNTTITHIEIPAPDLNKAVEFYSKVFGWQVEETGDTGYTFFRIGSTGTGGGFDTSLKPAEKGSGPQLVINVDDIQQTLTLIEDEGGLTTQVKTEIPGGHGFYAVFTDPNGNYLQIYSQQ